MSLRRNSVAHSSGVVIQVGIGILTQPLLAHLLGLSIYGLWALLYAIVSMARAADFGIATAFTVRLAAVREDQQEAGRIVSSSLILMIGYGAMIAGALFISSSLIATRLLDDFTLIPTATATLQILALVALVRMVLYWAIAWAGGLSRYDISAKAEVFGSISMNGGLIGGAFAGAGIELLAGWYLISSVLTLAFILWLLRHHLNVFYNRPSFPHLRMLAQQGSLYWLSTVAELSFEHLDRIAVQIATGLEATGLYSLAASVAKRILTFSRIPLKPTVPEISASYKTENWNRLRALFARMISVNGILGYSLATVVFWTAPWLSSLLSPTGTEHLLFMLLDLAFIYVLFCFVTPAYYYLIGIGRPGLVSPLTWLGSAGSIALIYLFGTLWGIQALAWGNLGYLVVWALHFIAVSHIGRPELLYRYAPLALCLGLSYAAARLLAPLENIGISAVGYLLSMLLLVTIEKDALTLLSDFYRRSRSRLSNRRE